MALDRIIRKPELIEVTGLSSATIYRKIKNGDFPRPVELGANSVGWRASNIEAWLNGLQPVAIGPEPRDHCEAAAVLRLDDLRDRRAAQGGEQ